MLLRLWIGDEGPLDEDLRDGDIWGFEDDSYVPSQVQLENWFWIKTDEYQGDKSQLDQPAYTNGPGSESVVLNARKYFVAYWEKMAPDDLVIIRDKDQQFPITDGVFSVFDITKKPS